MDAVLSLTGDDACRLLAPLANAARVCARRRTNRQWTRSSATFAHFITSFTPNAFFLRETFMILAMLVIGGSPTVTGAVLGTVVVTFTHQSLRWVENTLNTERVFETNIVGLTDVSPAIVLILMLVLRPAGIAERTEIIWQGLKDVFGGRPGRSPESAPQVE
jgi:hypothetical protein